MIDATWEVSLTTYCPDCEKEFDALKRLDFFVYRELEILDTNVKTVVVCPYCNRIFEIIIEGD